MTQRPPLASATARLPSRSDPARHYVPMSRTSELYGRPASSPTSGFLSTGGLRLESIIYRRDKGELLYGAIRSSKSRSSAISRGLLSVAARELPDRRRRSRSSCISYRSNSCTTEEPSFAGSGATSHPMAMLVGVVGSLSAVQYTRDNHRCAQPRSIAIRLIAKLHAGGPAAIPWAPSSSRNDSYTRTSCA